MTTVYWCSIADFLDIDIQISEVCAERGQIEKINGKGRGVVEEVILDLCMIFISYGLKFLQVFVRTLIRF